MHVKCKDECTFFSSGQDSLPKLMYLHCGLIVVEFPLVFYLLYVMLFQQYLEDTRVKKIHGLYAVNVYSNHILTFGINKSSGQSTVN